jgi:hypothetical protein
VSDQGDHQPWRRRMAVGISGRRPRGFVIATRHERHFWCGKRAPRSPAPSPAALATFTTAFNKTLRRSLLTAHGRPSLHD